MSHDQLPREQVLRLMRVTGTCLHVVSAPTREKILRCCARLLDDAADNSALVGELLPWMSQATQMGVLSPGGGTDGAVVDTLTRRLRELAQCPYDIGGRASRLHAFLTLQQQL